MKLLHFLLLLYCICNLVSGCAAKNVDSYKLEGERVEVKLEESSADNQFIGPVALALVPEVIDFGAARLEAIYLKESKKYIAEYSNKHVGEDFYRTDNGFELNYDQIIIERYVSTNRKQPDQELLASTITLGVFRNKEGTLLQLKPLKLQVRQTKAKLKAGDNNVDISLHIIINAYWRAKNQDIKSKEIADVNLVLKNITLGDTYELKTDESGTSNYLENQNDIRSNLNVMSEWFSMVPFSVDAKGDRLKNARGNFTLWVTATEIDNYGEKVAQFGKNINASKDILTDLFKAVIK